VKKLLFPLDIEKKITRTITRKAIPINNKVAVKKQLYIKIRGTMLPEGRGIVSDVFFQFT
jgi:hypothetical protein